MRYLTLFYSLALLLSTNIAGAQENPLHFRTPQDVVYIPNEKAYFVAYLVGDPMKPNGTSYISKMHPDFIEPLKEYFCEGLDAPSSITLTKSFLVVADLGSIKFFDRKTGAWQKSAVLGVPPEAYISDIVFDGERFIFACDMFGHNLLRIDLFNDFKTTVIEHGPWLNFPRRLLYYKPRKTLFIASSRTGEIFEFNPKTKTYKKIITFGPKQITGMDIDTNHDLYISSEYEGGQIIRITPNLEYSLLEKQYKSPANLIIIPELNKIILPSLEKDVIYSYELSTKKLLRKSKK
jgi:hypothetical protein